MARIIAFLLAFSAIGYGAWPYYSLYRLDGALGETDPRAIAPFVDLPAIQRSFKERIGGEMKEALPVGTDKPDPLFAWLTQGLERLGDHVLEQTVTHETVRNMLRDAVSRATDKRPAYFMAAVDYAFFSAWDRFTIRLGQPDQATHLTMTLEGVNWRVTGIGP